MFRKLHPAVFHGILGGLVVAAAKLVLAFSGKWLIRLDAGFNMLAFLMVLLAVIFAGVAFRKTVKSVSYGKALLNALITTAIVVFIGQAGDQVAYRTQKNLAEQTKQFQIETANREFGKISFIKGSFKENLISEMEKQDSSNIYSIGAFVGNIFTYVIMNMLFMLVAAIFLRKTYDPIQSDLME